MSAIEGLRDICWLVFDNRKIIARAKNEDDAKRVVAAMKLQRHASRPWPKRILESCIAATVGTSIKKRKGSQTLRLSNRMIGC
jgi:hypothetical protein